MYITITIWRNGSILGVPETIVLHGGLNTIHAHISALADQLHAQHPKATIKAIAQVCQESEAGNTYITIEVRRLAEKNLL